MTGLSRTCEKEGGIRGKVTVQGGVKGVGRCCWRALQELLELGANT
jgi:hypothetical protein